MEEMWYTAPECLRLVDLTLPTDSARNRPCRSINAQWYYTQLAVLSADFVVRIQPLGLAEGRKSK
jgi:hypothetical protein